MTASHGQAILEPNSPRENLTRSLAGSNVTLVQPGAPAFFDVPEVPHTERDRPGGDEHADEQKAQQVEVDVLEPVPKAAGQVLGDQSAELDRPGHERDGGGQTGDGDVVEDLADGLGERPAVGELS
jgi:hypothetical protein